MQFYDFSHKEFEKAIQSDLKDHSLSEKDLNRAVGDVLRVKFMLGLFDHPYTDTSLSAKVYHSPANQALSLEAAREGVCLLKNEGGLLPLKPNVHSVAVIGALATSTYLGDYATRGEAISILEGLRMRAGKSLKIVYAKGYSEDLKDSNQVTLTRGAVAAIKKCDISVVVLGENKKVDGEGRDRADLNLDQGQQHLLRTLYQTGKPVVVVLLNGRPQTINWMAQHIPSIVEGWYAGESEGLAIADVLLGYVNPSGKLPVTFPRSVGQLPFYYDHKPTSWHRYVDEKNTPLFPFGYGLSYTTFQYTDMHISPDTISDKGTVHISVKVTNTGGVSGTEVVELYIRDEVSSVTTPVEMLKGFQRISLRPQQTGIVDFKVPARQLSIWNRQMKKVVEPGEFKVMVGSSSADIRQQGEFRINKS
jgi:beta-glucosidase